MTRRVPGIVATLAVLLAVAGAPGAALAWRGHGGIVVFGPYHPYWPPYPVYPYPYPYPYPPPPPPAWTQPPPPAEDEPRGSYGLVQLRGVPEGVDVDLDGRFWLRAADLDRRWLALPEGEHRIAVRSGDEHAVERRVEVVAGKSQVVRLTPFAPGDG